MNHGHRLHQARVDDDAALVRDAPSFQTRSGASGHHRNPSQVTQPNDRCRLPRVQRQHHQVRRVMGVVAHVPGVRRHLFRAAEHPDLAVWAFFISNQRLDVGDEPRVHDTVRRSHRRANLVKVPRLRRPELVLYVHSCVGTLGTPFTAAPVRDCRVQAVNLQQKRVVPVFRIDRVHLRVGHVSHEFLLLVVRVQRVAGDAHDHRLVSQRCEHGVVRFPASPRNVVRVEGQRQLHVTVRVEPSRELSALVPEIVLDVVERQGLDRAGVLVRLDGDLVVHQRSVTGAVFR